MATNLDFNIGYKTYYQNNEWHLIILLLDSTYKLVSYLNDLNIVKAIACQLDQLEEVFLSETPFKYSSLSSLKNTIENIEKSKSVIYKHLLQEITYEF